MKLKVKLDKKTIQAFLIEHVEKIVFGAIVFVFLMMLYSALRGASRFDKTPDELKELVVQNQRVLDSTPPTTDLIVADYTAQAKRSRIPVEEKPYSTSVAWDPPLFEKAPLRDVPALFTVQKLRGSADVGAFQMAKETARPNPVELNPAKRDERDLDRPIADRIAPASEGDAVQGQRWIVITGLVPIEKQEAAYDEVFKKSVFYDPSNDLPEYLGYWVERLETTDSGDAANLDWDKAETIISSKAVRDATSRWNTSKDSEVVAAEYLDDVLVFPLGPLLHRVWDANVAHLPEIPLKQFSARSGTLGREFEGPGTAPKTTRKLPRERNALAPAEGARDEDDAAGTPFAIDDPKTGERDRRLPDEDRLAEEKSVPGYKLFRFFDFNVEPGKSYVYRVRLALRNPNKNLKPALLAKPEFAQTPFLETKWSDPSPIISVPRDTRVLALSVKPAVRDKSDPSGRILVSKWVQTKGIEVFEEFTVSRGQMANYSGVTVNSGGTQAKATPAPGLRDLEGGFGAGPAYAAPARTFKVNFNSNTTAIDFRGGERLPGPKGSNLTAPGEILMIDPDGKLVVHNELDDAPAYEQLTLAKQQVAPGAGSPLKMMVPPGTPEKAPRGLEEMFMPKTKKKR